LSSTFVYIIFTSIAEFYIINIISINSNSKVIDIIAKILVKKINTKKNSNKTVDKILNSNGFVVLANNLKIYIVLSIKNKKTKKYWSSSEHSFSIY